MKYLFLLFLVPATLLPGQINLLNTEFKAEVAFVDTLVTPRLDSLFRQFQADRSINGKLVEEKEFASMLKSIRSTTALIYRFGLRKDGTQISILDGSAKDSVFYQMDKSPMYCKCSYGKAGLDDRGYLVRKDTGQYYTTILMIIGPVEDLAVFTLIRDKKFLSFYVQQKGFNPENFTYYGNYNFKDAYVIPAAAQQLLVKEEVIDGEIYYRGRLSITTQPYKIETIDHHSSTNIYEVEGEFRCKVENKRIQK